jgi:putative hydroxymethylpyrimidine transport system permease protein
MSHFRPVLVMVMLLMLWQAAVLLFDLPHYILPSPLRVGEVLVERAPELAGHAAVTILEILLGLCLGSAMGCLSALSLAVWRGLRPWLLPVLLVSQAIPVFALAPVLLLWLGYGLASKVAMASLIIYFPVTTAFYDGLRRCNPAWLDLASTMDGGTWRSLRLIRIPAALPALASGLRVATAVAPIGAIVGEWVGSSAGLGYFMLQANARLQVDAMFAALFLLALFAVLLFTLVDRLLRRAMPWQSDDAAALRLT